MRKIHVSAATVVAVMLGATSVPTYAQGARPFQFGINAGASIPTGAFGDRVETGSTFGGDVAYRLGETRFGLQADVAYTNSGLTNKFLDRFSGLDDGRASILSARWTLRHACPDSGSWSRTCSAPAASTGATSTSTAWSARTS